MGAGLLGDETESLGVTQSGVHTPTPDRGRAPASGFYLWCGYRKTEDSHLSHCVYHRW